MGQKKLLRFTEIKSFLNVLEYPDGMKGKWKFFFKNDNPITLELACGKGEYAVGLGRLYPQRNFIGIDIKGNRMWRGAKTALEEGLQNVAFLRSQVEKLTDYFDGGEVQDIWITFPDPQLRLSRAKKRLTHPRFLRLYQQVLSGSGVIHLKTDSPDLYRFTLEVIKLFELHVLVDSADIHADGTLNEELSIQTHYEKLDIAQSSQVHYLSFQLNAALPLQKDDLLKQLIGEKEPA